MDQIRANLERITEEIYRAAVKAGRSPSEVRLLVVSKAQPVEKIAAAYQAGARLFGENYPEETLAKIELGAELPGIEWHMIGHLQSRKAKIIAQHFSMLHSLDSFGLAEKLERLLAEQEKVLPVLLEVNVSGEESKFGLPAWHEDRWSELLPEIERVRALPHLNLCGLMTMPPLFDDPVGVRPFFQRAHRLLDWLAEQIPDGCWKELSMGTSGDFPVAVEEGATYVRIGTAIMGPRPPRV